MEEKDSESQSTGISSQPAPLPEPIEGKPWLRIILFSVLSLLFAGGLVFAGYFLGKNANVKTQISKPQPKSQNLTSTKIPVVSPISDVAKDWKTYTNTKYDVTFQYPQQAELKEVSNSPGLYFLKVTFIGKKQSSLGKNLFDINDGYVIDFIFADYPTGISTASQNYERLQTQCSKTASIEKIIDTTFASRPAQMLTVENCGENHASTTYYYLSWSNEGRMEISSNIAGELQDKQTYQKTVEQILSTFRFLE